jgi:anaerobic magnesium-protoporphyrin IX monomethyl ester cyclase
MRKHSENTTPKILFIIPPSNLYPLGSAYVAAVLKKAHYSYDVFGFFYDNNSAWFKQNLREADLSSLNTLTEYPPGYGEESLFAKFAETSYDFILIGGLIGFFRWFYRLIPPIKGYLPQTKLIMGGGITKDLPEEVIFDQLKVDYILKGEAETNLAQFLTLLTKNSNPKTSDLFTIPGLCWKTCDGVIHKNRKIRVNLTQETILPAWNDLHITKYIELSDTLFRYGKKFFPVLPGRGCPNVCAFCSPSVGKFRETPVAKVIREMIHWEKKYPFDFFFLYSEVAFNDESYTREFCHEYQKHISRPWVGQLRTDVNFSQATFQLMKDSGCLFLLLGIESASDRILKVMKKNTSVYDHVRNIEYAQSVSLPVFGNFIFGHRSETADEIRETFRFAEKYDLLSSPNNGFASLITYPGTSYYRDAYNEGMVSDPLKFLLSYSMKASISSPEIRNIPQETRLNLTALSENEYYETICIENIRYNRNYSKRHQLQGLSICFKTGKNPGLKFSGLCPTCGTAHTLSIQNGSPLSINAICTMCWYTVEVDIFSCIFLKEYMLKLQAMLLSGDKKVLLVGPNPIAALCNPSINLPVDSMVHWIDPNQPLMEKKWFYHLKQISLRELQNGGFDRIVSLMSQNFSLNNFLINNGIPNSREVIHLFPDDPNMFLIHMLAGKCVAYKNLTENRGKIISLLDTTIFSFEEMEESKLCWLIDGSIRNEQERIQLALQLPIPLERIIPEYFFHNHGFFV